MLDDEICFEFHPTVLFLCEPACSLWFARVNPPEWCGSGVLKECVDPSGFVGKSGA